jgi:3-chloro-4-hydroxyphenylacetate reductive dehalogenase
VSGYHKRRTDPFPVHILKRVDRPTTRILDDEVKRFDARESGFLRSHRGDYGPRLKKEYFRFVQKHPASAAALRSLLGLVDRVDGPVAERRAPIPGNPAILSRHIKDYAYFLRADLAGICRLPPYAAYTHSYPSGKPVELDHAYAIAILVDQDWKTSHATTGHDWVSNSMSFMSYSASAFIACTVADYIRRLGYQARAHHAMNYLVAVPPILLWAGLGEMSRIGGCVVIQHTSCSSWPFPTRVAYDESGAKFIFQLGNLPEQSVDLTGYPNTSAPGTNFGGGKRIQVRLEPANCSTPNPRAVAYFNAAVDHVWVERSP